MQDRVCDRYTNAHRPSYAFYVMSGLCMASVSIPWTYWGYVTSQVAREAAVKKQISSV